MSDLFAEERLQFFLRNKSDIKTWAAIEADVIVATRELLARSQPSIEENVLALDPTVLVGRHDNPAFERILARRENWPESVGVALEWHRTVDPSGSTPPKLGVFWWAGTPDLIAPRTQLIEQVDKATVQKLGYKVPLEGVWPVGARVGATPDWWRDPDAWVTGIVDQFAALWPAVAPFVDDAIAAMPEVSRG